MSELSDEQIEALCEAATPGPWEQAGREIVTRWSNTWQPIATTRSDGLAGPRSIANAALAAAARSLVPSLLERARKAEAEQLDVYELRERGIRVLADDQCCELGCAGGACESCPCCCAGWCVAGYSGEIPNPADDAENYAIWLDVAQEHNLVAKRLAEVEAERDDLAAKLRAVEALHYARGRNITGQPVCAECSPLQPMPCPTLRALSADTTPEATERRCNYNVGDDKPCRCLLPHGHAGLHQCEHTRERSR